MKYKIKTLVVTLMISLTAIVLVPEEIKSIADPPDGDNEIGLDLSYVYNITENLSYIVYNKDLYPDGEIAKGRGFGTPGERKAADDIAKWMENISLWDPTTSTYPDKSYRELIKDETSQVFNNSALQCEFNDNLEVLDRSLEIYNISNGENETVVDYYTYPRWNRTFWNNFPRFSNYNEELLTHEFVENELKFRLMNTSDTSFYYYFNETINNHSNDIINNNSIIDPLTLIDAILNLLEEDYKFTFDDLIENPENVTTLPWYNESFENSTSGDYVYIAVNPEFNPNDDFYDWREYNFNFPFRWLNIRLGYNIVPKDIYGYVHMFYWYIQSTWCCGNKPKALVLYDHNNNTYNMGYKPLQAGIPIININRSLGEMIIKDVDNFRLNYTLNQSWDTSIESYNVIGQINGTNQDETVILGCLYDSWWNQGTADSAIGIGIMLSIAKYVQYLVNESDGEIRPRCNLRFVAFAGEECDLRGAYAYEYNHREDENLVSYIDLNQLGYTQSDPRQALYIVCNRVFNVPLMKVLGGYTNFEERINDATDFKTMYAKKLDYITPFNTSDELIWDYPSDHKPFVEASKILYNTGRNVGTYCFIKEDTSAPGSGWLLHHRSGLNHTEGDSMKYYNHTEVNITTEMVWNVTKYLAINPDCWFDGNPVVTLLDTNDDENYDSVEVDFTVKPTIPHDRVGVRAILRSERFPWKMIACFTAKNEYIITSDGVSDTLTINLPKWAPSGSYSLNVHLYNSTGHTTIEHLDDFCYYLAGPFESWQNADIIEKMLLLLNNPNINYFLKNIADVTDYYNLTLNPFCRLIIHVLCLRGNSIDNFVETMDYFSDNTNYIYFITDDVWESENFNLYPCNSIPSAPEIISGDAYVDSGFPGGTYIANSTDDDNDSIYYQWKWETACIGTLYTPWILGGPYDSGENCTQKIIWAFPGEYQIWVRAKDRLLSADPSGWSEPKNVTVNWSGGWNICSSPFGLVSSEVVVLNQPLSCNGVSQTVEVDPESRGELSFYWDFGDGNTSNEEDAVHNYSQIGNYTVNLTVTDDNDCTYNQTSNISIVALKSEFDYTVNSSISSNLVCFEDISAGLYTINNWSWDFGDGNTTFNQTIMNHTYATPGVYNVILNVTDNQSNFHSYQQIINIEKVKPVITNVTQSNYTSCIGGNITVNASAYDQDSGMNEVFLNVSYPDGSFKDFEMGLNDNSPEDYQYVFDDIWQNGIYYLSVIAFDNASNMNCSVGYLFNVSSQATISVCTLKDEYSNNEFVNLTDPPGDPPLIGYELLDDDSVLHIWNKYDSYYFDTDSGIQLTNHKDEYWSHNVLMLGYYNNDEWNLMYRTDELSGFTKNIDSDDETYINITLWKDLSYGGYDFRLAIRYYLGVDDNELTVTPYIKNIDDEDIPYTLGFGWELKNIMIDNNVENDQIRINETSYLLNQTLDEKYTNITKTIYEYNETTNTTTNYTVKNGIFHLENLNNETGNADKDLYLKWNPNLDYLVWVKSRSGQYNAPTTLFIKVGTLAENQERSTEMYWHDSGTPLYERYNTGHDAASIMYGTTWNAQTFTIGNTSTNENHDITSMKLLLARTGSPGTFTVGIRATDGNGKPTGADLTSGSINGNNLGTSSAWHEITITPYELSASTKYAIVARAPSGDISNYVHWRMDATSPTYGGGSYVSSYDNGSSWSLNTNRDFMFEEYGELNNAPTQSDEVPTNGSTGISLTPDLLVLCTDADSDTMNATWWSNSSGTWVQFGSNETSFSSGTNITQTNSNFTGYETIYYWSVNVTDGGYWTNGTYHFTTGTMNLTTAVDVIDPYNQSNSTLIVTATVLESLPDEVSLYYRYSDDNNSWEYNVTDEVFDAADSNSCDVDGSADVGVESDFAYAQDIVPDSDYMNLSENYTAGEAVEMLDNPSFTGGTTNWTLSGMSYDASDYQDSAGSCYDPGGDPATNYVTQDGYDSYLDSDIVTFSCHYMVGHSSTGQGTSFGSCYVEIENQSDPGVWTSIYTVFENNQADHSWTYTGVVNVSSYFGTGNYRMRFRIYTEESANGYHRTNIDNCSLSIPGSDTYKIDFEYQWTNTDYNKTYSEICIYIGNHTGSENLLVNYWTGSTWSSLGSISDVGWTNLSATGLDSSTYTIQFVGTSETADSSGDSWDVDVIMLHTWNLSWTLFEATFLSDGGLKYSWNFDFDFPDGVGYYEFFSIGWRDDLPDESFKSAAETGCHFRYQSKIKNTGSYDFRGYLLMQVQFYDDELGWVVANDTVNESESRWISSGEQLGLDTVFNGEVNVNDLSSYGTGLYRIYVAFRDPYGNVLVTDDDVELMASFEFDIKFT